MGSVLSLRPVACCPAGSRLWGAAWVIGWGLVAWGWPLVAGEPEIWSVAPLARPALPEVRRGDWVVNAIDRFILARLEAEGLEPAPPLDPARLIRRVYFDLWGLPPDPAEVRAFVADPRPEAYAELVDRLLAAPQFGERWGRYWLDVARYADTNGYERDAEKPAAWRYRDWVIRAHNDDKPYDRFVQEQLAGDELPDASDETRIATGFLRVGTFDDEPNDPLLYKFEQLDDLMHATSTAFLALTLKCARCHDHKYDPIPQTDYYAVLNSFVPGKAAPGELLAFTDERSAGQTPVKLLAGGDPRSEGEVVPPGYLSLVPQVIRAVSEAPAESPTTTRRRQLAEWITDPANPLTPRVAVNRLWQHHFGQGLSRTGDNFGNTGWEPTHPELLDWLAGELVAGGWRQKRLHRLILLSNTYLQSSVHPREAEFFSQDPENLLLWKAHRQRLDAEALRDAILAVSGQLDRRVGGPGFVPDVDPEVLAGLSQKQNAWKPSPPEEQRRRSVYLYVKRSLVPPLWTVFDFADTTQPCCQRNVTTVAPQALALLNNRWVHGQSRALAERLAEECPRAGAERVERLWWLTLGRAPSMAEATRALAHVEAQRARFAARVTAAEAPSSDPPPAAEPLAWASLCHVVLNTNEFSYVD